MCFSVHTTQIDSIDEDLFFDLTFESNNEMYGREIEALLHQTKFPGCEFDTQDLIDIAVGPFLNLPNFLQFNVYKFTNPPVIRNLHDLPSLRPWYGCEDSLCVYADLFFNKMAHAYFSKKGSYITDYLSIATDDAIIGEIEGLIPNIPDIIPLFNNARMEMRRAGMMIGASKSFGNWRLNGAIPLYYLEQNFFLTQKEVDALNASAYFGGGQPIPDSLNAQNAGFAIFNPNTFINRYLVSDKIGLGDIRIYLDYMFAPETPYATRVGGQLTLPNNTVIRRSIIGNSFSKCSPGPGLSIGQLAELQCIAELNDPTNPLILQAKNDLSALAQNYALNFLERLSSTVIENELGQRQASYGFLAETFLAITHSTNICLFFEWDQFIKGYEDRPVKLVITPSQSLDRDYENPALAQDNLTFLQQRTLNILFPPIANLQVKQGDIIKARAYSQTNWRILQWDIGYDLWLQTKEQVMTCYNCALPSAQLDIQSAQKPAAMQGKLFGHINLQKHPEYYETFGWRIGLAGEATVNNYGIGKDWLVAIDFVADF